MLTMLATALALVVWARLTLILRCHSGRSRSYMGDEPHFRGDSWPGEEALQRSKERRKALSSNPLAREGGEKEGFTPFWLLSDLLSKLESRVSSNPFFL